MITEIIAGISGILITITINSFLKYKKKTIYYEDEICLTEYVDIWDLEEFN